MAVRWRKRVYRRWPGRFFPGRLAREDFILCAFFSGIVLGTIAANGLYPALKDQAAYYMSILKDGQPAAPGEDLHLFAGLLRRRGLWIMAVWVLGLTVYGSGICLLFAGGAGVSLGVILTVFTAQKGVLGLPLFLISVFPQALFFCPAWGLLLLRGSAGEGRFRFIFLFPVILLFMTVLGCACEVWLNPFFLGFLG